jgi:transposase-like protein
MAAGDITFIECPFGDLFPVRKTAPRAWDFQSMECPRCGEKFEVLLEESVERLSPERNGALSRLIRRFVNP